MPSISTFFALLLTLLLTLACKDEHSIKPYTPDPAPGQGTDPAQFETPFAEVPATSDIVMYEINERAFSTSGDFAGILPRLDSIRALGVNVIWLMPIHPIGPTNSVNSPYSVADFKKVNPEFGDLDDLRTLVREAHERKMAVVLDWVANHTSWDNPWLEADKSWYTQDASGNVIHPDGTNWQDVADLNFSNSAMRLAMISAMKYWVLAANVDGYRCDAADWVPADFWKQAIDSLHAIPGRDIVMLAEGARSDHFASGFQMNFGWDFFSKNKGVFASSQSANGFLATHQGEYNAIPAGSHKLRFTSNHDECAWDDTPLGLFGGRDGSVAAFVVTAFMGGVPLIYNGQEVGCPVKLPFFSRSPIDWTTNPDLFQEYKWLMGIRSGHEALRSGSLESFSSSDVACFLRSGSGEEVLVVANVRNATKTFQVPSTLQSGVWQDASNGETVSLGGQLALGAFEYRILMR